MYFRAAFVMGLSPPFLPLNPSPTPFTAIYLLRRFLLPSYFPLVLRAVSSLEGVALSVDKNFKLISAGKRWNLPEGSRIMLPLSLLSRCPIPP